MMDRDEECQSCISQAVFALESNAKLKKPEKFPDIWDEKKQMFKEMNGQVELPNPFDY